MKALFNRAALLLALVVAVASQSLTAQVGGNKPEFFLWRYNGATASPGPVVNGDIMGTIQWKGTVPGNKILTGADIQAVCTGAPTSTTLPTRLSLRTGTPTLAERLTVLENGNVGINTTSPTYRLHVVGNGFFSGDLTVGGNFGVTGSITAGLDVIAGRDVKAGRHVVAVENVSGKNIMASELVSGKNVSATDLVSTKDLTATNLVSTKNLTATETVAAKNITASQNVTATGTVSGATVNSSGNMTAGGTISGATVNSTGNMTAGGTISGATVNATGNMTAGGTITSNRVCTQSQAIGVASCFIPTGFKLAVGGGIIAEEVLVQLRADWPDYVFEKEHDLPTLDEVSDFVQKEKHLPGIPSAAEICEKGLDLGDMQRRTMEKLEELYLLTIQLNGRIGQLEKENAALKSSKN